MGWEGLCYLTLGALNLSSDFETRKQLVVQAQDGKLGRVVVGGGGTSQIAYHGRNPCPDYCQPGAGGVVETSGLQPDGSILGVVPP